MAQAEVSEQSIPIEPIKRWSMDGSMCRTGYTCHALFNRQYVGMDPDKLHFNIHLKTPGKGTAVTVPKAWEDFHNYGLEWTADYLRLYLDGKQVLEFPKKSDKPDEWPFAEKQYLLRFFPQRLVENMKVYEMSGMTGAFNLNAWATTYGSDFIIIRKGRKSFLVLRTSEHDC